MTITDRDKVEILCNYAIDETKLTKVCSDADDYIKSLTNIDWSSNDYVYGILKEIGACYAAWCFLVGWNKDEYFEKAKEMREMLDRLLERFEKIPLPEDKTNPDIDIAENEYTITALNPDIPHFLSTY